MIIRYLIATLGALTITIALLMFMKDVTTRYVSDDPVRYFRILDFIPGPDRGRERIQPPSDPRLAPSVPELEQEPLEAPRQQLDPSPDITIEPEILRAPVVPESA